MQNSYTVSSCDAPALALQYVTAYGVFPSNYDPIICTLQL